MGRWRRVVVAVGVVLALGACSSTSVIGSTDTGPADSAATADLRVDTSVDGDEPLVRDIEVEEGKRVRYRFDLEDGLGYDVLVADADAPAIAAEDSDLVREERNYDTEEEQPSDALLEVYDGFTPLTLKGAEERDDVLTGELEATGGRANFRFVFWSRTGDERPVHLTVERIS